MNKSIKKLFTISLISLIIILVVGCGNKNVDNKNNVAQQGNKKAVKLAYITPGLDNPFWKTMSEGIHQQADKVGIELKDFSSNNDANTQMKNVQDVITQKYDGILLTPTDSASAPAVLKAAQTANIPVILVGIGTDSGEYLAKSLSTEEQGGYEAGKYLADAIKKKGINNGTVAEISISLARDNGRLRDMGFQKAMKEAGLKVVDIKQAQKYTRQESVQMAQDLITAHPDLAGIFANFDEASLGALKAIETAGKSDKIILVGYDGSPESAQALKEGKLDAISMQQTLYEGRKVVDAMYNFLTNKVSPPKLIEIPTLLVTRDNINQLQNEIYKNVFTQPK
ncbi:substrate-binding domain-containing protein [Moorella naiadis]|uniref:substrate-binding domain-containing protein n=1 Tax=Moorella naiadis (nom. illeg.) TaxID=3093670 RepID=UPI003D9CBC13